MGVTWTLDVTGRQLPLVTGSVRELGGGSLCQRAMSAQTDYGNQERQKVLKRLQM